MKKILSILVMVFMVQAISAQAPKRRTQQQQATKQSNANTMTTRAQIAFPTESQMSEDVVWRRDVYRELDLTEDANAGLYYPVEPIGTQMNLFTYMFKLVMRGPTRGGISAYEYRLDGNENFSDSARIKPLKFLDDYHIFYERTDKGIRLDDSDIPSAEVKGYYIKESSYYDQTTATFHTKVQALCPILSRQDDFGDGATKYPLFWVKYEDVAPFLAKQTIMTSNLNNAATMSVDDYFTMNKYSGKIYKTNNMLGQTLAQMVSPKSDFGNMDEAAGDSLLAKAQNQIEAQIKNFETNIWGDQARKDSLDSIAKLDPKTVKAMKKQNKGTAASSSASASVKKKPRKPSASSSSSSARVTVRRERH